MPARALTHDELKADLTLEQLKELVGLVEYDAERDVFPVTGWDAMVFVVGNATQTAHYYQPAFGMELEAYRGPENGTRDHKPCLRSGSVRFVITGAVTPTARWSSTTASTATASSTSRWRCRTSTSASPRPRSPGRRVVREPHDESDEHGTVRIAAIATYGETVHTLVDRSRYDGPYLPGLSRRGDVGSRTASRSGCSRPSTTSSATSSSAGWTSG